MSSGERAALLATPSRGDGGAFAPTTTERDVEVAASNGVGASSPRSSAWRRRSYLWLTIASTATFAIIMTIVAYGVAPSTAVADGGLTTAAAGTRATLGGRARGVGSSPNGVGRGGGRPGSRGRGGRGCGAQRGRIRPGVSRAQGTSLSPRRGGRARAKRRRGTVKAAASARAEKPSQVDASRRESDSGFLFLWNAL